MLFTIQDQTLHGYDLDTGKPLDNISALTEQIQSDEQDVNWTTTSSFPLMFLKGDEDNSLFILIIPVFTDMFWEAAQWNR
mgnify:CR=1 FL=1